MGSHRANRSCVKTSARKRQQRDLIIFDWLLPTCSSRWIPQDLNGGFQGSADPCAVAEVGK
jgi:hypothetical protein